MKTKLMALEADIAQGVEPHGWLIDGSLLYRLNDHGNNCDEINVSMANGSRTPEIRAFVAAALLTRITTPQEPAAVDTNSDGYIQVIASSLKLKPLVLKWYAANLATESEAWLELLNYINGLTESQHKRSHSQEPAASGWMPMETAPKDGVIDISTASGRFLDCFWGKPTYGSEHGFVFNSGYDCDGQVFGLVREPLHWMHAPAAPGGAA
jgi:hypothetical protein